MGSEKDVRDYLRDRCREVGWICLPLVDVSRRGFADRTVIGFGGRVAFVEVKEEGYKHDSKHLERQRRRRLELLKRGHIAVKVEGKGGVQEFLKWLVKDCSWPVGEPVESRIVIPELEVIP